MKKLSSLLAILLVFVATSFANSSTGTTSDPGNKKLTEAFTKQFSTAKSVSWSQEAMITTASFILDGQYLTAHFTPDAKMLGVSKNLVSNDLPLNLKLDLRSYFEKYWISDIFEYATSESDSYYVTLENAGSKLVLKSEAGSFQVYKKTAKAN